MPITRKQFELGVDAATVQIMKETYGFLRLNREAAFSMEELDKEVFQGRFSRQLWSSVLRTALDKLVELEVVEERHVRGTSYYAHVVGAPPLEI